MAYKKRRTRRRFGKRKRSIKKRMRKMKRSRKISKKLTRAVKRVLYRTAETKDIYYEHSAAGLTMTNATSRIYVDIFDPYQ